MKSDTDSFSAQIYEESLNRETSFLSSKRASFSKDAVRYSGKLRDSGDLRLPYAHDIDRIIHSKAYARYQDKTQVFSQVENDHISRRIHHVQMVARIARTIGRALHLNEDLIEAISLGHDIGHTPFGHAGEAALTEILQEKNCGSFAHNAQSVRVLQKLERKGIGLDLTLQTLDGILGHNGEIESPEYRFSTADLTWENLNRNLENSLTYPGADKNIGPSTMEGCVVRVSDIISYIGKDIDDAVTLKLINKTDLPSSVTSLLGNTNREIIDILIKDLITQSFDKEYLCFSEPVYKAFTELKQFNYEKIYHSPILINRNHKFNGIIRALFEILLNDLKKGNRESPIFKDFLANFEETNYSQEESKERIVADYIAGMTDDYFLNLYRETFTLHHFGYNEPLK